MIRDIVRFDDLWSKLHKGAFLNKAVTAAVRFVEDRTGGSLIYNAGRVPFMRTDLVDLMNLAERMRSAGLLQYYIQFFSPPDEPQFCGWRVRYHPDELAGGMDLDDRSALTAALAETTERYIWFEKTDHFRDEYRATVADILTKGPALLPERFSSFTKEFRRSHRHAELRDVPYIWVRGLLLPDETPIYLPAQIISAASRLKHARDQGEPLIAYPLTTGIATWPDRTGALVRGMLEILERDAFMITWLNQLSMPRFDADTLAERSESLKKLIAMCRRYRLEPHFVRLATDAPTYAIAAVVEDITGTAPRFGFGLKAGYNLASVAESALFEALRGRVSARFFLGKKTEGAPPIEIQEVGHHKRLLYWAEGDRAKRLEFFIAGEKREARESWEDDTESQHLERLLAWVKERGYACATVPLTSSSANLTTWHIENVVIPELQRMHFRENEPYIGPRVTEVSRVLGLTPRSKPYLDDPHPFS